MALKLFKMYAITRDDNSFTLYGLMMTVCTDGKGHFILRLNYFSTGGILSHLTSASLLDTVVEIGSQFLRKLSLTSAVRER